MHSHMTVVVTGGAGFIGANLCRHLLQHDAIDAVVALDDLSNGVKANLEDVDVRFVQGDICDPETIDAAFDGADAVIHLAALGSVPRSVADPMPTHHNNVTGTLSVLEGARRAGNLHTVVASSSSVYGGTAELPKHEALPTRPLSPYGVSKLATEAYALAYQHSLDLPTLAFRFFNVFGPLQPADHVYAAVLPRFIDAALAGRPLTIHGDGLQSRDFTYVDTVASTLTRAVVEGVTHHDPVNLAFGQPRTLLDVIGELEQLLGRELERNHVETRTGDIRHSDADCSTLESLFPGTVPTPFVDGLAATLRWFETR